MEKLTIEQIEQYLRVDKEIICSVNHQQTREGQPLWGEDTSSSITFTTTTTGLMNG
ncbi:hypothetical protein [Parapedobacter sp. 10938]|uniref:hypothetical protein n=1 Tax=Parapedobacter flavus TaxID=3110225 RepID=UPI002DBE7DB0|nr:hypothetical protein [Parapedobacter sp. 10938]MEC3880603.1 hypothetical protein [Parapedobacter sp. 10938]